MNVIVSRSAFARTLQKGGILASGLILLHLCGLAGVSEATVIEGRVTSNSYLFQPLGVAANPDPDHQLDFINRLSLDVRELGHPSLSFYFLGALRGEMLDEGFDSTKSRLHRGELRYTPSRHLGLTLGRQWVYGGVGSALVDGARIHVRRPFGQLIVFGGNRGYLDPEGDTAHSLNKSGWDESGIVGAFFRSADIRGKIHFGLSAASSMYQGEEESDRLGVMATWRPSNRMSLFYEHRYELNRETSYYQHLRYNRRLSGGGFLSLAWNHREAWLPEFHSSYIYERFMNEAWFPDATEQETQEIRGHLSIRPEQLRGWRVALDVTEIFPDEGDRGDGLALFIDRSFQKARLKFGYRLQRGFRGEVDGFFGSAAYDASERIRLWADLNRFSYLFEYEGLPEYDPSRHVTIATRLGADYSLPSGLWLSGALEGLDNPGSEYDFRFLLRISYRFRHETQSQEGQS